MRKLVVQISTLLLLSISILYPQSKFSIEIGGGMVKNTFIINTQDNLDKGWIINIGGNFKLNSEIQLTSAIGFQNYGFNPSLINFGIISTAIAIPGIKYYIIGNDSQIYEAAIGIRIIKPMKIVSTFLSLRIGVLFINRGEILVTSWKETEPQIKYVSPHGDRGNQFLRGFGSFGLGGFVKLAQNLSIGLEGRLNFTLYKHPTLFSTLTTNLQYSF